MRYQTPTPLALATTVAIALLAVSSAPAALHAQDASRHDQQQQAGDQRHDQQPAGRPEDHHGGDQADHADRRDNDADALRRDHPGATARCHDGFFTKSERRRACTRHGGIDVWLGPDR